MVRSQPSRPAPFFAVSLMLVLLVAAVSVVLPSAARAVEQWRQVTVIYNSDVGGKVEPCG